MAEDNKIYIGKTVFSWLIKSYEDVSRNSRWYIYMGAGCLVLIIYAIITSNFLFALIILLFAFILVLREFYMPERVNFQITELGIVLGDKFYPFKELKDFYIIYEPPETKRLYFSFKSVSPILSIDLEDQNPIKIREYLLLYLQEDLTKEDENFTDSLNRLLKL